MATTVLSTPPLRELQRWMAGLIVGGAPLDRQLESVIDVRNGVDAVERLRVYAKGYPARVRDALLESFPGLAHVIGDGPFWDLVHRYINATSLHSYNLNDAGADLTRFLTDDELCGALPFLPDLAQLEWNVARAFHAFDEPVLDPTSLSRWSPEQWELAVLRFQPWVALVASEWPIRTIWACRETPIEAIDIDLHEHPNRVLVRRNADAVLCESIPEAEACALVALIEGQTLGTVVAALAARGDDPATVSTWFARWMALRMITRCDSHTSR